MSELKDTTGWRFVHAKATEATWEEGLRKIFEYRDLGVKDGSHGSYVAHVIRRNGKEEESDAVQEWHHHECNFQLVYVLEGWAEFEYEGEGVRRISKGDCILQRPFIKHREIACSDDFEVLEVVAPADFATAVVAAPTSEGMD